MADQVQTDARAARLAAALRTNLGRRKARDRARGADAGDPAPQEREAVPPLATT